MSAKISKRCKEVPSTLVVAFDGAVRHRDCNVVLQRDRCSSAAEFFTNIMPERGRGVAVVAGYFLHVPISSIRRRHFFRPFHSHFSEGGKEVCV